MLAIVVVGMMLAYSTAISVGLANMGAINILPTIFVLICSLVTLILTFVYLSNLLISIIVVLPAVIIYGINVETGISGNIIFLLSLVFLPVIPMIISLGLGVLIAAVSSRSKHKNILSLVLSTLVVLLIVAASTQAQNMKPDEILDIGLTLSLVLYPFPSCYELS